MGAAVAQATLTITAELFEEPLGLWLTELMDRTGHGSADDSRGFQEDGRDR